MTRTTRVSFLNAPQRLAEPFRLLLVDNDAADRARLSELLRERGHEVRPAATGPEAVALAGCFEPDSILMDLTMPSHGEMAMLKLLMAEQLWSGVPVIVFTRKHTDAALLRRAGTVPSGELEPVLAAIRGCGRERAA